MYTLTLFVALTVKTKDAMLTLTAKTETSNIYKININKQMLTAEQKLPQNVSEHRLDPKNSVIQLWVIDEKPYFKVLTMNKNFCIYN